jgi:ubiquinone/menaquinone biosynthesis C-methylase UbiE
MERLREILKTSVRPTVLDVGTGQGFFIKTLLEYLSSYEFIIGIDTKEEVLAKAREIHKNDRIKFISMDGENIHFEDNSMDIVCISNTLHHLPNKKKVLMEMKRVLKTNGFFIVNEMFCDNQSQKQLSHVQLHHLQGELDTLLDICHNKTFTMQQLTDIVEDIDLKIERIFEYNTSEEQAGEIKPDEEVQMLDECFAALEIKLEKIKGFPEYGKYEAILNELKKELYNVGFFTASELMIVCKK